MTHNNPHFNLNFGAGLGLPQQTFAIPPSSSSNNPRSSSFRQTASFPAWAQQVINTVNAFQQTVAQIAQDKADADKQHASELNTIHEHHRQAMPALVDKHEEEMRALRDEVRTMLQRGGGRNGDGV